MRSDSFVGDVLTLAKVRLNSLVVVTTAGGYYMASHASVDLWRLGLTCAGTALVAGGASAINQITERDTDRLMERTKRRPVPDGRMSVANATTVASLLTVLGIALLASVGNRPAAVALATLLIYVFAY